MLTSATTLVERRKVLNGDLGTHPYEAGWAAEALFFVQTEGPHPALRIQPQISPDGIHWLDFGQSAELGADQDLMAVPLSQFGTWIRLMISGATPHATATVLVRIALKG